mmetsp:Transcript_22069/g.56564  ORF Transcript_22069/g.56564 Transcript_22069/m.56564 type:complete len:202 (+) Transcript_22069:213-818(+)
MRQRNSATNCLYTVTNSPPTRRRWRRLSRRRKRRRARPRIWPSLAPTSCGRCRKRWRRSRLWRRAMSRTSYRRSTGSNWSCLSATRPWSASFAWPTTTAPLPAPLGHTAPRWPPRSGGPHSDRPTCSCPAPPAAAPCRPAAGASRRRWAPCAPRWRHRLPAAPTRAACSLHLRQEGARCKMPPTASPMAPRRRPRFRRRGL